MQFSKYKFKTFTVTVADPAVFTSAEHELYEGDQIILSTTGALPTGLTANTVVYYVIRNGLAANTFQLSLYDNSQSTPSDTRIPITTTGTQSGTHSYFKVNRARLVAKREDNR
jgi:hypothetical protein